MIIRAIIFLLAVAAFVAIGWLIMKIAQILWGWFKRWRKTVYLRHIILDKEYLYECTLKYENPEMSQARMNIVIAESINNMNKAIDEYDKHKFYWQRSYFKPCPLNELCS